MSNFASSLDLFLDSNNSSYSFFSCWCLAHSLRCSSCSLFNFLSLSWSRRFATSEGSVGWGAYQLLTVVTASFGGSISSRITSNCSFSCSNLRNFDLINAISFLRELFYRQSSVFFLWVNTNVPSTFQSCWLRGSSRPRVHTCSHRWSAQTLSGAYTAAHTSPATLYYSHAALSYQPEVESAVLPSNSSGVESAMLSVVKFRAQAGCFVSWVPSRPALICFRFQLNGCIVQSALSFWQCQPIYTLPRLTSWLLIITFNLHTSLSSPLIFCFSWWFSSYSLSWIASGVPYLPGCYLVAATVGSSIRSWRPWSDSVCCWASLTIKWVEAPRDAPSLFAWSSNIEYSIVN